MLSAKLASPLNAVAKPRLAPGARSCRISSIAVPSSPLPSWPGSTSTGDSSPEATEAASESTPSDRAHSLTPTPVTPLDWRAVSAACTRSPWLVTAAAAVRACLDWIAALVRCSMRAVFSALDSASGASERRPGAC